MKRDYKQYAKDAGNYILNMPLKIFGPIVGGGVALWYILTGLGGEKPFEPPTKFGQDAAQYWKTERSFHLGARVDDNRSLTLGSLETKVFETEKGGVRVVGVYDPKAEYFSTQDGNLKKSTMPILGIIFRDFKDKELVRQVVVVDEGMDGTPEYALRIEYNDGRVQIKKITDSAIINPWFNHGAEILETSTQAQVDTESAADSEEKQKQKAELEKAIEDGNDLIDRTK